MRTYVIGLIASLGLVAPAWAEPPKPMTNQQLDAIVAGRAGSGGNPNCGHQPAECGNNGWGNGYDGWTPGSFVGNTGFSKSANEGVIGDGRVNVNPTTSSGR
jgi:hypothetical protein